MARKIAISTQLKNALTHIVELEKKLKEADSNKDTWYKKSQELEQMLEQVHQVLDAVPGAISRKSDDEDAWRRVERTVVTRMAAWLASRGQ